MSGSIALTEEHTALAEAARGFLERHCPPAVVRAVLQPESEPDVHPEQLPPFWSELASLGWLALHFSEANGGQGFGLLELGVVLEEMGRAGAPGPFLPTVLASAVIERGGAAELRSMVLPELARGAAAGAVAFPATSALVASPPDPSGVITVSGTARPVPCAEVASWLVLPARAPASEIWCVISSGEVSTTRLPSLDATRQLSAVQVESIRLPPERQLSVDGHLVATLTAALASSECAGGSAWCVDTAASYAKTRKQFGRPIGQFQAVKHRCADMLMAVEQARAVAWDALRAADDEAAGDNTESALAGAAAAAVAPESFYKCSKDLIQVLGGIGFTWEHDAHIYLRRATSMRQLLTSPSKWRGEVARMALAGTRRQIHVELPPGAEGVRAEIRAQCEEIAAVPKEKRRQALVEAGLFVPHWPKPWGRDAGPVEQLVIDAELRRARLRRENLAVGAWAAPTIVAHGTPEQQRRWVGPTLLGEISWCQLFSEPDAGSDLASLTTKAIRAEGQDGWLISGQKVWTSLATQADWGICLARTDPSAPKHAGITYFVIDMRAPGIDIRPLRELTGFAMFNEVFLTDVFVPEDCVVGPVNGGWALARTTLANERVAMASGSSFGGGLEALLALASGSGAEIGPVELDALGALAAEAQTVSLLGQRATQRALTGSTGAGAAAPEASVRKLLSAEHDQRVQELGLSLLGGEGATTEGLAAQWSFGFLANRCLTIAGGTSEVQRNVIAERLLGLPRDPEPIG